MTYKFSWVIEHLSALAILVLLTTLLTVFFY